MIKTHVFPNPLYLDQIRVDYSPVRLEYDEQELDFLEKKWITAHSDNTELFDGELIRLIDFSLNNPLLVLKLGLTSYKEYVGTRGSDFIKIFGFEKVSDPVSVVVLIRTADDFLLFGKRSSNVESSPSSLSFVSGWIDPILDKKENSIDLLESLYREISEEINVNRDQISDFYCIGFFQNPLFYQHVLLFVAKTKLVSSDILTNFKKGEFTDILFEKNNSDNLKTFISSKKHFSDIAIPSLSMYVDFLNQ